MCGIVGYHSSSNTISEDRLLKATMALEHRGPDGQKVWISQNKLVGLGHSRLSIIDLATGDQPLHDTDNKIHLVMNGELYDFENIRNDLIKKGHKFKTKSDSEIAIYLYKEYGLDFVSHLRGEFAILLWDENQSRLIAIRDRFGIKPLYYARLNGNIYFASEAKALFPLGVPASWDEDSLFHSISFNGTYSDASLFKNIKSLPAGHMMVIDPNGVKTTQYWDFEFPLASETEGESTKLRKSDKEYIDEFRELFREAVQLRLRSDVPVATYLSGGLDSSAITTMAQACSATPIRAFTLAFDDDDYNESALAQETCKKFGVEQTIVPVTSDDIAKYFEPSVWHAETLALNGHVSAKYMLSDVVRNAGYKVVLTGEGSDEILAGYAHFRQDLLLHKFKNDPKAIDEHFKKLAANNAASAGFLMSGKRLGSESIVKALGHMPSWMENLVLTKSLAKDFFHSDILEKHSKEDIFEKIMQYFNAKEKLTGIHPVNQSAYLWSKISLQNYILCLLGDRLEMAHSIEGRVPFLDHKLVSFAMKLPIDLKIRDLTEKYILREATKDILTEQIYKTNKHPFMAAPALAKSNKQFYDYIQASLRSDTLKNIGIFNHKNIVSFLDNLAKMSEEKKATYNTLLHTLTSVCAIHKPLQSMA